MLKNTFRRLVGILIVAVMGIAVLRFLVQTWGSRYLLPALGWGMSLIVIIGLILWGAYRADRHINKRED